jgi:hypothetical protein
MVAGGGRRRCADGFTVVAVRDSLSGSFDKKEEADEQRQVVERFRLVCRGSKSALSCNCIVQSMSGRVAAGHPAAGWGQVSRGQAAAPWREPAKYGGRGRLVEEAS